VASLTRRDHQALAVTARSQAETLLDTRGELDTAAHPELAALADELRAGWLRHLAAAEPSSAV
jgi:hypothetical protein